MGDDADAASTLRTLTAMGCWKKQSNGALRKRTRGHWTDAMLDGNGLCVKLSAEHGELREYDAAGVGCKLWRTDSWWPSVIA